MVSIASKLEVCEFSWGGGQKPLLGVGYIWPVMPIFELEWAIPVKSHVWEFGLVEPFKSNHLNYPGGGGGGRNPLLGGLHVTCDAHFRTWPSYSSQKSCVKIWFGLVEAFEELSRPQTFFRGGGGGDRNSLSGVLHLTCDAHFRTRLTYSSQKSC